MAQIRRKTYKKKKTNKKKSAYSRRKYPMTRYLGNGIPDRVKVQLKYSDVLTITTGVAGTGLHVFRGNSIYDPDVTSTGHQPLYHDNYAALYERYIVTSAKMDLLCVNHGATDSCIVMCIASTEQYALGDINANATFEQPYAVRSKLLSVASQNPSKLSMSMTSTKALGQYKTQYLADDINNASFGANPTREWFFNVAVLAMNGASSQPVRIQLLITYNVECFDRKSQAAN